MYLLIGGSGGPNYGDELMVKGWLDYLSKEKEVRVEVNIKNNAEKFHDHHRGVSFSEDLKNVAKSHDGLGFWEQVARGANFFRFNGIKNHSNIDFSFIDDLQIVHLHGGGYLNKNAPVNGFLLGFCYALKKEKNIKLIASGIGLMPNSFPSKEKKDIAREVFSSFDGFELRDHESFLFVKKIAGEEARIYMGLDDSFLMDRNNVAGGEREFDGRRTLYLSFAMHNLKLFEDGYWSDLKKVAGYFDNVAFWECFPWKDKEVFSYLKEMIPSLSLVTAKEFVYGEDLLSRNDFLITSRFHPHLVSSRIGMDGIYYANNEYYDVKQNSVISSGSQFKRGDFSRCYIGENFEKDKKLLDCTDAHLNKKKNAIYEYMVSE